MPPAFSFSAAAITSSQVAGIVERGEEAGGGPGRQPVLSDIGDIGLRAAAEAQDHRVVIVLPGVVGDVDLDAGVLRLELARVVLDRVEGIVPDDEFERNVLRQGCRCEDPASGQCAGGEEPAKCHVVLPVPVAAAGGRLSNGCPASGSLTRRGLQRLYGLI
jgi:hypothetical protein